MLINRRTKYFGLGGAIGGVFGFYFCELFKDVNISTPGLDIWLYEKNIVHIDTYYQNIELMFYGIIIGICIGIALGITYGILLKNPRKAMGNGLLGALGGLIGGSIGGLLGNIVFSTFEFSYTGRIFAWGCYGTFTGLLIGRFVPDYKTVHGFLGGVIGGLSGGIAFSIVSMLFGYGFLGRAIGITTIGFCIGIFISLAEFVLKKAWLEIDYGRGQNMQYFIHQDIFKMGTSSTCNMRLFGERIEPVHAEIRVKDKNYIINKIAAQNPLYLNETSINSETLKDGDKIKINDKQILFKLKS